MKFIDFFAGVGGFRRGMELAGHECVGFCEFDKYAVMSYTSMHLITEEQRKYLATLDLKARQKEILKDEYRNGEWYANDVRTVDAGSMPDSDCWCFGFPCQDISVAGAQKGFSGNRSSLFFEVMRLLDERKENGLSRPRYLFIENVKNLLSVSNGFDFAKVLFALDERGYDAEWSVLDSQHFGVPQHRERCFIIGSLRGSGGTEVFPVEGTNGENRVCEVVGHRDGYRRNLQVFGTEGATETLDTGQGGGRGHHTVVCVDDACERVAQLFGTDNEANPCAGRVYSTDKPMRTLGAANGMKAPYVAEPLGGVYTKVTQRFQRGILPGTARCLKSENPDAAVAYRAENDNEDE